MNKIDFLALLNNKYEKVGTPKKVEPTDEKGITRYIVNVLEKGLSDNQEPVFYRANINFYVIDEGSISNEQAGYERGEPKKYVGQGSQAVDSSLTEIAKVYNSANINLRVGIALVKKSISILKESIDTKDHISRSEMAVNILKYKDPYVNAFLGFLITDNNIQNIGSKVTDLQIEKIISDNWNVLAIHDSGL